MSGTDMGRISYRQGAQSVRLQETFVTYSEGHNGGMSGQQFVAICKVLVLVTALPLRRPYAMSGADPGQQAHKLAGQRGANSEIDGIFTEVGFFFLWCDTFFS